MVRVSDIVKPREKVLQRDIESTVKAYKVDSGEERIESSASEFLETTYPSNAIRDIIEQVNRKLKHKDDQGAFLLQGPYGSGKSHALITLYHLFDHSPPPPPSAEDWTDYWGLDFVHTEDSESIILSAQNEEPDELWVPLFKKAGREDLLDEFSKYPTTEHIEELVGESVFAIFLDEIETWWESFDQEEQRTLMQRNKLFLQNLLEVAEDSKRQLFVFITLLDKTPELKEIINRTSPHAEDISSSGDREKIIKHRMFKNPEEDLDREKVREVVREYIEGYSSPIEFENEKRFEEDFVDSYPFHPQLLHILDNIYEGAKERQNVRGELLVLADMIAEKHDKTGVFLLSDLNHKAFRTIDRDLVNKYETDVNKRVSDISYGDEILKSVLLYSLVDNVSAATEPDILKATLKPTEGMTVTDLSMSLENLYGKAHYLHKDDGHYKISNDLVVPALIQNERNGIDDEDAEEKLSELVQKEVFNNQVHIYTGQNDDEIPDDRELTFVVSLKSLGDEEQTKEALKDFYHGRRYQNTLVFIMPKGEGLTTNPQLLGKVKRIIAAENLKNRVEEKESEIDRVMQDDIKEVVRDIKDAYGYWIKWSQAGDSHEVEAIRKQVEADIHDIKDTIRTDKSLIEKIVWQEVQADEEGRRVESLLDDFKKMRKYPLLSDDNLFFSTVKNMIGEKVYLEGDRGKIYRKKAPSQIKDEYVLLDPEYVAEEAETNTDQDTIKQKKEEALKDSRDGVPEPEEEDSYEITTTSVDAIGNSPRSILATFEGRLNSSTDTVENVTLEIDLDSMDKEAFMEFVRSLPGDMAGITAHAEVERREDTS
jgi:hypothetical protein